jgi:PAS domain S-box-containing protein
MKDSEMSREQLEQELHRLRTSHDFLDRIVNGMFEALMVIDPEYKIKDVNSCFIEKYGKPREELIGHTCHEVTHRSNHPCATENHGCPLKEIIKSRATVKTEHIHKDKQGNESIVEIYCFPLLNEAGNVEHIVEVQHDITEQRRARKAIEQGEQRFKEFFENQPDYCYIISPEKTILDVNHVACKTLGYTRGQLVGKPLDIIYAPECHQKMNNVFTKWVKNRKIKDEEMVIITRNGERRNVLLNANAVTDEQGNIVHSVSVQKDITDYKRAEKALANETTRHRVLIEQSRDGIVILDEDGAVYEANRQFAEMLGYSREEVNHLHVWDWDSNLPAEQVREMLRTVDETGDHFETVHTRKDGTSFNVEISTNGAIYEGQKLIFCVCRDITQRKQAERALAESEEKYRMLVENSQDSIVVIDLKGNVLLANKATEELTGYTIEEGLGMNVREITPKQYWIKSLRMLNKAKKGRRIPFFESMIQRKDGTLISVESGGQPIIVNGKITGIQIITRDISERKQAEQALRESEEKFRNLVEKANDGVCIIQDGIVEYANPMLAQLWRGAPEEIIGSSFKDFIHEDDIQTVAERYMNRIAGEKVIETYDVRMHNKKGEIRYTELSSGLITYQGKPAVMSIVRDITERIKTEAALRESEERHRILIENAAQSIIVIEGGIVKFANSKTYELHGYTVDEMNSMPLENLIHPDDRELVIERRNQRLKGSPIP